jgi:hypothetical protein
MSKLMETELDILEEHATRNTMELAKIRPDVRRGYQRGIKASQQRWGLPRDLDVPAHCPPVTLPKLKFLEGDDA